MKKCIIFCAGGFEALAAPIGADDVVIAADGGVAHTEKRNITPHVVLGDFDSLQYVPMGAEVHPVEKDDTDAMLAIKKGLSMGCREFVIYGGLDGDRLEHTVANFQALQYLASISVRCLRKDPFRESISAPFPSNPSVRRCPSTVPMMRSLTRSSVRTSNG